MKNSTSIERFAVATAAGTIAAAIAVPAMAHVNAWIAAAAAAACVLAIPWLARRLPSALDGALRRRTGVAVIWGLSALLALLQMGRLSAFMADPSRLWGSALPGPLLAAHQCLAAYIYAAELTSRSVANVYDERWYPPIRGQHDPVPAAMPSSVDGLSPWIEDRYLYPPQFLLLPRGALAVTHSFGTIRAVWFVIQALVLLIGGMMLAKWIGGAAGLVAGLMVPVVLSSVPTMINLQFGQFHMMAIVLAIGGMVAFEKRHSAVGGALLAAAILSKIFPGVLLVMLAAQRRWRDIGATLLFLLLFTALAVLVLGSPVFTAFLSYELPRLSSGAAYAFLDRSDMPALLISRNLSIYGIVPKLRLLGIGGMTRDVANIVSWVYTFALIWLAWRAARAGVTRLARAQVWLAVLNLAAFRPPLAPSGYVAATTLALLALLAPEVRGRWMRAVLLGGAWLAVMGPPPLPGKPELVIGLATQAVTVGINVWVILRPRAD